MSFYDHRANGLLSRVRDDVSDFRNDLGDLLTRTTRHTIPKGARQLADTAHDHLASGRDYAVARFRSLRGRPAAPALGVVGGAILVGLIAAGAYAFFNSTRKKSVAEELEDELEEHLGI